VNSPTSRFVSGVGRMVLHVPLPLSQLRFSQSLSASPDSLSFFQLAYLADR